MSSKKLWIMETNRHQFYFLGQVFPGSREDIIEYMHSVGYSHVPDGHKESGGFEGIFILPLIVWHTCRTLLLILLHFHIQI
jgi:hypothetical protein